MKSLTPRQLRMLQAIERSVAERGMPPTYKELAAQGFGISTNGVGSTVEALVRHGYLRREGRFRALRVVVPSTGVPVASRHSDLAEARSDLAHAARQTEDAALLRQLAAFIRLRAANAAAEAEREKLAALGADVDFDIEAAE